MEETCLDRLREVLALLIDPDHGLLEKLRKRNALSLEDKEDIRQEKTYIKRNQMVLKRVSRNEKFDELLLALREVDQSHVANYIHYNGGNRFVFFDLLNLFRFTNRPTIMVHLSYFQIFVRVCLAEIYVSACRYASMALQALSII